MKKASIVVSLILLGLLSFWVYRNFISNRMKQIDPLLAVPVDATFIIEINKAGGEIKQFYETSLLLKDFENTPVYDQINQLYTLLDSLPEMTQLAVSTHSIDNNYQLLISIADPGNAIKNKLKKSGTRGENNIYKMKGFPFFFSFLDNIILLSKNTGLLKQGLESIKDENSILSDSAFVSIRPLADPNVEQNLFVNLGRFRTPLNTIIKDPHFQPEADFMGWVVLDLTYKSNTIAGSGFIKYDTHKSSFFAPFADQVPQNLDYFDIIPVSTAWFTAVGQSNPKVFFENLGKRRPFSPEAAKLVSYFSSWMGNTFGTGILDGEEKTEDLKFAFFSVRDTIVFRKQSVSLLDETFPGSVYRNFRIQKLNSTIKLADVFGDGFSGVIAPYFTFVNSYLLFANNPATLKTIIKRYKKGQTLSGENSFANIRNELLDHCSFLYYLSPAMGPDFLTSGFTPSFLKDWLPEKEARQNLQAMVVQFSSYKKGMVYMHSIIRHQAVELIKETDGLWDLVLKAPAAGKPKLFKNYKTGNYNIIVRDKDNRLYFVSNTGDIIWEKPISQPVLGKINKIDVYKNGKTQLLFNTADSLFCLDRKGNDVAGFPVALPSKTSNPLALFDYDFNRNFRILIGTNDGNMYMYGQKGSRVKGWKFKKVRSAITGMAKHLKLGKKDYILVTTGNGTVLLLDRKGKSRYRVSENIGDKSGPVFYYTARNIQHSGIFYIDTLGQVVKLKFGGKKEYLPINGEQKDRLKVKLIPGENKFGFFVYNSKKISFYYSDGKKIFDPIEMKNIEFQPNFYRFDSKNWIGIVDNTDQQAYLIDFTGIIKDGFPLTSSIPFSIGDINGDGIMELVGADSDGRIIVYALNE